MIFLRGGGERYLICQEGVEAKGVGYGEGGGLFLFIFIYFFCKAGGG